MRDRPHPAIGLADAIDLCLEVYATRQEALEIAHRLRAAGWVVLPLDTPGPEGVQVVAAVYHPQTYESPGEVAYRAVSPKLRPPGAR